MYSLIELANSTYMQKLSREIIHTMDTPCQIFERVVPNIYMYVYIHIYIISK